MGQKGPEDAGMHRWYEEDGSGKGDGGAGPKAAVGCPRVGARAIAVATS